VVWLDFVVVQNRTDRFLFKVAQTHPKYICFEQFMIHFSIVALNIPSDKIMNHCRNLLLVFLYTLKYHQPIDMRHRYVGHILSPYPKYSMSLCRRFFTTANPYSFSSLSQDEALTLFLGAEGSPNLLKISARG